MHSKRSPSGLVLLLLALVMGLVPLVLAHGCARPGTLRTQAAIADAMSNVINDARQVIEERIRIAEQSAVELAQTREEALAAVLKLRAKYSPLEKAYEALRLADAAYVQALQDANADGANSVASGALDALTRAWVLLGEEARALGVRLPDAPKELRPLLGGGS